MKSYKFILLILNILCIAVLLSCAEKPETMTVPGASLNVVGRFFKHENGKMELITSAAHTGFAFKGKQCTVYLESGNNESHSYIQYELDGVYKGRLRINGLGDSLVITSAENIRHEVMLYKTTEAHSGPLFINRIAGVELEILEPAKKLLFEIIGNSITCGAASDTSDVKCNDGEYHDKHNAYMAYGPRVARATDMDFVLNSVSGIGIYRTWNMEFPNMPLVYESLDFSTDLKRKWDFATFSPDIICVALGTNDFSNGDGQNARAPFDAKYFTERYTAFVKQIKDYHLTAAIVLMNSPMVNGERNDVFLSSLLKVKTEIDMAYPEQRPVDIFEFASMQAGGCSGHPSVEDHAVMAEELTVFMKKLKSEIASK